MNSNLIHRNDRTTFSSLGSLALRLFCLVFRLPTERLLNRQWGMRRAAGISLFIHQLRPFRTRVVSLFEDKRHRCCEATKIYLCTSISPRPTQLRRLQTVDARGKPSVVGKRRKTNEFPLLNVLLINDCCCLARCSSDMKINKKLFVCSFNGKLSDETWLSDKLINWIMWLLSRAVP